MVNVVSRRFEADAAGLLLIRHIAGLLIKRRLDQLVSLIKISGTLGFDRFGKRLAGVLGFSRKLSAAKRAH